MGRALIVLIVTALVALAGGPMASAEDGSLVVHGTALSRLDPDLRRLTVTTTSDRGIVRFTHLGAAGVSRFSGSITCLVRDGNVLRLTGEVLRGTTASGMLLDGQDFGFTIDVAPDHPTFSLPRFAEPGTLAPCTGGRVEEVPVTEGMLRVGGG